MKKRVMDDSRIVKKLKKLAWNAIDVLNESRGACSCYEAGKLRRDLQKVLRSKEGKSIKTLIDELIPVLSEVAEFFEDPKRSFKSDDFKELGNKISGFLDKIES
jgi:hypothetical protein